jgi:hypothetical protein
MVCWYLVLLLSGITLVPTTVNAAFISPSGTYLKGTDVHDLSAVKAALESDLLRERLEKLGLSPEEIKSRLESLSPDEHQAVLADVERIQAGGDGVGTLITLAVLVLLVILILKLMDKEITIK